MLYRVYNSAPQTAEAPKFQLSDGTQAVLRNLETPVEIRYYALLDPAVVPASLSAYAGRVDQLLGEYQGAAAGKITVTRFNSPSDAAAKAAAADRIEAFNRDKGDACYLGITVVAYGNQKESLRQLAPEWEAALESDLTRALARVVSAKPPPAPVPGAVRLPDEAAMAEVKRDIPDLGAVSIKDGRRILHEKALGEFTAATEDYDARIKAAEERFTAAQSGGAEAVQQAAREELLKLQGEQTKTLTDLAARLKARLAALERLKTN